MDDLFHEMTHEETTKAKRPLRHIIAVVAVVLAVAASLIWLIVDPFAKPAYATFEDSVISVRVSGSRNDSATIPIEPQRAGSVRDHTPIPLHVTVLNADLKGMTVTVCFNKALLLNGKAVERVTFRYDETLELFTEPDEEGETGTVTLTVELPQAQPSDDFIIESPFEKGSYSYLAGDGAMLWLYENYYELLFEDAEEAAYGTYEWDEDTLILTENAGLTRYVFERDGASYVYDHRASYRHRYARTPAMQKGDTLTFSYTFTKEWTLSNWQYSITDHEGTALLEGVSSTAVTAQLVEPHLLRVNAYSMTKKATAAPDLLYDVYYRSFVGIESFFVPTQQYCNLQTGECSKVYEFTLCDMLGGTVYATEQDGQAVVILEPMPWSRAPAPQTLTVALEGFATPYAEELVLSANVSDDRFVVRYGKGAYGTVEVEPTVVAMDLQGKPLTTALLAEVDGTLHRGDTILFMDGDRMVHLNGITTAYYRLEDVYVPLQQVLDELWLDAFEALVLADVAAGRATQTVWEDGVSFTACYGDEYHNVTFLHTADSDDVYIGVIPDEE